MKLVVTRQKKTRCERKKRTTYSQYKKETAMVQNTRKRDITNKQKFTNQKRTQTVVE